MEHTKLKVRGKESNGLYAIVDEESNDKAPKFYEEVQTLEQAERFVKCWNSHDDLLEIANMVKDMPSKNDTLFDAHCANLRKKAKQVVTNAQDAPERK